MADEAASSPVKNFIRSIDWRLLLFLLLFLDVKLVFKVSAIVLIYILRFDVRLGLRWRSPRLPLFYPGVIAIGLLDWLIYGLYGDRNYTIGMLCGLLFWVLCLLATHQVKLAIERSDPEVLHRTLFFFFAINAAISFMMLFKIMIATGSLNPFTYQGEHQKYFLGTGDYIKGLTFDTSVANALINAFGVVYFLSRRRSSMVLICMIVLLLTASNLTNLILVVLLIWFFLFRSDRLQKSLILVSLFMLILFMVKVSPENREYASREWSHLIHPSRPDPVPPKSSYIRVVDLPDSILSPEQRKQKMAMHYMDSVGVVNQLRLDSIYKRKGIPIMDVRPLPRPDINAPLYQNRNDTTEMRRRLIQFNREEGLDGKVERMAWVVRNWPGKIVSLRQTAAFFARHPLRLISGDGMGRFSSKQAFRTTALGIAGKYPLSLRYIDPDFRDNHFLLYSYFFTNGADGHSIMNTPDSVVDQLISEYGLAGLAVFLLGYCWFFARRWRKLSYGLPLLILMMAGFFTGYWFEQLSVVVLFELMMMLDMGGSVYAG